MNVYSVLEGLGIEVREGKDSWSTRCPKCSHVRRKKNRPCLGVKIDEKGWVVHCFNCGWSEGGKSDAQPRTPQVVRGKENKQENTRTYRSLQRTASPKWRA